MANVQNLIQKDGILICISVGILLLYLYYHAVNWVIDEFGNNILAIQGKCLFVTIQLTFVIAGIVLITLRGH